MSFIERVKQTRDELMAEKEQVLVKVKWEIEQSAKNGRSSHHFGTIDFNWLILGVTNKEITVDKYFQLMNYVIESLSKDGFEIGYNHNENGFYGFHVKW